MNRHPTRLSAAGIGRARFAELRAICRGYGDMKRDLRRARAGIVDRRRSSGAWHLPDPTGAEAVALASHPAARRVKLIEDTAMAVGGTLIAPAILESVTEGRPFEKLRHRPPVSKNPFYALRMDFYIALDRALWEASER